MTKALQDAFVDEMRNPLTTKDVILLVLNRGSLHGRGIIDEAERLGVTLHEGSLYPALHMLKKAGLVRTVSEDRLGPGRPRQFHHLTAAGNDEADRIVKVLRLMTK